MDKRYDFWDKILIFSAERTYRNQANQQQGKKFAVNQLVIEWYLGKPDRKKAQAVFVRIILAINLSA